MKYIEGFDGLYAITKGGRVWSYRREYVNNNGPRKTGGHYLKPIVSNPGYPYVNLWKNGTSCMARIHALLAKAYLPNPHNLSEVNHKNGIKTDNRLDNLEWCTHKENMNHAMAIGLWNPYEQKRFHGMYTK